MRNLIFWYSGRRFSVTHNQNQPKPILPPRELTVRTQVYLMQSNAEMKPRLRNGLECPRISLRILSVLPHIMASVFSLRSLAFFSPHPTEQLRKSSSIYLLWVEPQRLTFCPSGSQFQISRWESGPALVRCLTLFSQLWPGWVWKFREETANTNSEFPEKGELLFSWQTPHTEKEKNNSSFASTTMG